LSFHKSIVHDKSWDCVDPNSKTVCVVESMKKMQPNTTIVGLEAYITRAGSGDITCTLPATHPTHIFHIMIERTPADPEYYAELLQKSSRPANRQQQINQQSCGNIPGIQNVDDELSKRLRTLLDVIADISICKRGNVSATMASVIRDGDVLKTQLYIVFKSLTRQLTSAPRRSCRTH
jgi:hypothetical protein